VIIKQGFEGHHPPPNNALKLRHVEQEQEACVPWVAEDMLNCDLN
jgi:hypothetical protein